MSAIEDWPLYKGLRNSTELKEIASDPQQHAVQSTDVSLADPIPCFLSDHRESVQPEFAFRATRQRSNILGRAFGLAISAVAILAAALNSDVRGAIIDESKILINTSLSNRTTAANDPVRAPSEGSRGPIAKDIVSADHAAPNDAVRATRNEAATRSKTPDVEMSAALTKRARSLLALGDVSAARLFLERAANAQDGTAAFLLAQTYDPTVLGVIDARSIVPDPAMARDWYRKAASLGSVSAQQQLARTQK
jgi:hypothetical protein